MEEKVEELADNLQRLRTLVHQKDRKIEALQSRIRVLQRDST